MRKSVIPSLALFASLVVCAHAADNPCCEVAIASQPDSPAHLAITVKNASQQTLWVAFTDPRIDYVLRVVSADSGKQANRTQRGKATPTGFASEHRDVAPGQSFSDEIQLAELFELAPGTYKVSVTRKNMYVGTKQFTADGEATITIP
jgi:hypothetical protein